MQFSIYILPVIILSILLYCAFKRVKVYDGFVSGVKDALPLVISIFPYITAILIVLELFQYSGLSAYFARLLSPFLNLCGIPKELSSLMILKPFSGNGSMVELNNIYENHGADSYIGRCASCVYGCSDTVFYILAVYFANSKHKKFFKPVAIALFSGFIGAVFACFICRFL